MRDIRFRGFSVREQRWVAGSLLRDMAYDWETGEEILHILEAHAHGTDPLHDLASRVHPIAPGSFGEHIGILDTACRMVYTGDVVQVAARNGQQFKATVVFSQKLKQFWLKGDVISCGLRAIPCVYTIIGNSFDEERVLQEEVEMQ